ncbi:MAG: hypothetical protein M1830_002660, partial [Pleopsidium flavum]
MVLTGVILPRSGTFRPFCKREGLALKPDMFLISLKGVAEVVLVPTHSSSSQQSSRASSVIPHSHRATPDSSASDSSTQWLLPKDLAPDPGPSKSKIYLADLANYLSLGSVRLQPLHEGLHQWTHEWSEVQQASAVLPRDHPVTHSINKLRRARWIRLFFRLNSNEASANWGALRVYCLPDDAGRSYLDRTDQTVRKALKQLIPQLDISCAGWMASFDSGSQPCPQTLRFEPGETDSLFYVFNTLRSPSPDPLTVQDVYTREAMGSILNSPEMLEGLTTALYPYQRRSAAMMIQREAAPARMLDPRLERLMGPTEDSYFYDKETGVLVRNKREYEEPRGGILAETMGLGKTLICLAVILATRGHWPQIPPEYSEGLHPVRKKTGSLLEMTAAAMGRERIPWKAAFENMRKQGIHHESCLKVIRENACSYLIPGPVPRRSRRLILVPKGETIRLSSATLIIVPPNLIVQWRGEIARHVDSAEGLQILILDSVSKALPSADELLDYDIVLLSKQRFEREVRDGEGGAEYRSPLKDLHWLRIIVDEGHSFASSGSRTNAVHVLDSLHVERRWIVSGTPTNGLMGVEVSLAAHETLHDDPESPQEANTQFALEARKQEEAHEQEYKDLEKLGRIVVDFLKLRPWANSRSEDAASWQRYILPHVTGEQDLRTRRQGRRPDRQKSGSPSKSSLILGRKKSSSLRNTLEGLVIRHRIEDIEKDLQLPPLHNRIVYLEPSYHDKMSINLFILVLASNAITSERTDQDYMFHPKNRKLLNSLITNLRQSGFWWTGFTEHNVSEALRVSKEYLDQGKVIEEDRALLGEVFSVGERALASSKWRAFSRFHELGIYLEKFPEDACEAWALHGELSNPLLMGTTQVKLAQRYVASHLYATNPAAGLAHAGTAAMEAARKDSEPKQKTDVSEEKSVLRSSVTEEPKVKGKRTISGARLDLTPTRIPRRSSTWEEDCKMDYSPMQLKSALKVAQASESDLGLPMTSPLRETNICGTASAKLSYLIDRVIALQKEEKVLIFYEGDNIAYYIGEALELVDVKHLIYAKSLSNARRAAYIATFNTTETFRVLLMDVHQAAHGLHIASASRVFFVNPVWQPNVEAQAIKRAHRIGQTRPVFVETLVLRNTLEDSMLQRRKAMTITEHQRAEKSLLDDSTMGSIIQNAKFISMSDKESSGQHQMARLAVPQQVFGRVDGKTTIGDDPDADIIMPEGISPLKPKRPSKRKLAFLEDKVPRLTSDVFEPSPSKRKRVRLAPLMTEENSSTCTGGIIMESPKKRWRKQTKKGSPTSPMMELQELQQNEEASTAGPVTPPRKK